jgi:carboxypeptidase D
MSFHGTMLTVYSIVLLCSTLIVGQRSPLKVEKDAAIYQLLNSYHHYTELDQLLHQWALRYSHLAQLFSVGQTVTNNELFVMRITLPSNSTVENNVDEFQLLKPKMKWIANMHGDETIGREMLIALIYYLLLNSKTDARISRLLSTTDIYMNPVSC